MSEEFDWLNDINKQDVEKMAKHDIDVEPLEIDEVKSEVVKITLPIKREWILFRDNRRLTVRTEDEWQRLFKNKSKDDKLSFGVIANVCTYLERFSKNMGHPSAYKFSTFFEQYEQTSIFYGTCVSIRYYVSVRQLGEFGGLKDILGIPGISLMCYRMSAYMLKNGHKSNVLASDMYSFENMVEMRYIRLIELMHNVFVPCRGWGIIAPFEDELNQALDLLKTLIDLYIEENNWDKVKIQEIIIALTEYVSISIKGHDNLQNRYETWLRSRGDRYGVDVIVLLKSGVFGKEMLSSVRNTFSEQQIERTIKRFEGKMGNEKLTDEQKDIIRRSFIESDEEELT